MPTMVPSDDVQPGDLVESCGHTHRLARVDRRAGWAWPIAFDDCGWAIALGDAVAVTRDPLPDTAGATPPDDI